MDGARELDECVRSLECKVRGASCLGSPYDHVNLLNSIGEPEAGPEFDSFCRTLIECRSFNPFAWLDKQNRPEDICVEVHLKYRDLGMQMDVSVVPHRAYGARMTMHWKPLPRDDRSPDAEVWKWQDMNGVSRIMIGYAIMTSEDRDCFSRWEFLE